MERQAMANGDNLPTLFSQSEAEAPAPAGPPGFRPPQGVAEIRDRRSIISIRDLGSEDQSEVFMQNFFLQGWRRSSKEQLQTVLHSEGWTPIFYQSRPIMWNFSGLLYDGDAPFTWTDDFISFYNDYMRGSRAAGRYSVTIVCSGRIIQGYVHSLDVSVSVPYDTVSQFVLGLLATSDETLVLVDNASEVTAVSSPTIATNGGIVV